MAPWMREMDKSWAEGLEREKFIHKTKEFAAQAIQRVVRGNTGRALADARRREDEEKSGQIRPVSPSPPARPATESPEDVGLGLFKKKPSGTDTSRHRQQTQKKIRPTPWLEEMDKLSWAEGEDLSTEKFFEGMKNFAAHAIQRVVRGNKGRALADARRREDEGDADEAVAPETEGGGKNWRAEEVSKETPSMRREKTPPGGSQTRNEKTTVVRDSAQDDESAIIAWEPAAWMQKYKAEMQRREKDCLTLEQGSFRGESEVIFKESVDEPQDDETASDEDRFSVFRGKNWRAEEVSKTCKNAPSGSCSEGDGPGRPCTGAVFVEKSPSAGFAKTCKNATTGSCSEEDGPGHGHPPQPDEDEAQAPPGSEDGEFSDEAQASPDEACRREDEERENFCTNTFRHHPAARSIPTPSTTVVDGVGMERAAGGIGRENDTIFKESADEPQDEETVFPRPPLPNRRLPPWMQRYAPPWMHERSRKCRSGCRKDPGRMSMAMSMLMPPCDVTKSHPPACDCFLCRNENEWRAEETAAGTIPPNSSAASARRREDEGDTDEEREESGKNWRAEEVSCTGAVFVEKSPSAGFAKTCKNATTPSGGSSEGDGPGEEYDVEPAWRKNATTPSGSCSEEDGPGHGPNMLLQPDEDEAQAPEEDGVFSESRVDEAQGRLIKNVSRRTLARHRLAAETREPLREANQENPREPPREAASTMQIGARISTLRKGRYFVEGFCSVKKDRSEESIGGGVEVFDGPFYKMEDSANQQQFSMESIRPDKMEVHDPPDSWPDSWPVSKESSMDQEPQTDLPQRNVHARDVDHVMGSRVVQGPPAEHADAQKNAPCDGPQTDPREVAVEGAGLTLKCSLAHRRPAHLHREEQEGRRESFEKRRAAAATMLQRQVRGRQARHFVEALRNGEQARQRVAALLQSVVRGRRARKKVRIMREEEKMWSGRWGWWALY